MAFLSPVRYLGVDDIVVELGRKGLSPWLYLLTKYAAFIGENCYLAYYYT
jgi:hypothetical protein